MQNGLLNKKEKDSVDTAHHFSLRFFLQHQMYKLYTNYFESLTVK